jgi:hypothetical protein
MKYWEDYKSKWGFGDGDSVPPDAEAYWVENMRVMNALLEKHGSGVRLVLWFRNGMHNCYLLVRVTLEQFSRLSGDQRLGRESCEGVEELQAAEPPEDEGWGNALDEAFEMDGRYGFVVVDVTLDREGLASFCRDLAAGKDFTKDEDEDEEVQGG